MKEDTMVNNLHRNEMYIGLSEPVRYSTLSNKRPNGLYFYYCKSHRLCFLHFVLQAYTLWLLPCNTNAMSLNHMARLSGGCDS